MDNTVNTEKKKRIFSGVQPSGRLHIGNYIGSVNNWKTFEETCDALYCVVDMHAITVRQDPAELRRRTYETMAVYIASGLNPEKNTFFVQSHVHQHAELAWVLDCYAMFGELSRMTQFKDKSKKYAENINGGLFTYPVLMAADILLYQTDIVPVGIDQLQHIELARDIANRFNGVYSDTFKIPEGVLPKSGAKIMSLAEPEKKMSKSDANVNGSVLVLDSKDDIIRKFRRAVTDSDTVVRRGEGKDGINNLMTIYSAFTGKSDGEIEKEFDGKGYGDFKSAVGETVADALTPVREKYESLMADKAYLESVMKNGADYASYLAEKTLSKVYRKVGFVGKIK